VSQIQPKDREPVRVRYSEGETGWCYDNEDGTGALANIPLEAGLNIGDKVELVQKDGWLVVGDLLERQFPCKTQLRYSTDADNFDQRIDKVVKTLHLAGAKAEGMVLGMITVAHNSTVDPRAVFEAEGIEVLGCEDVFAPRKVYAIMDGRAKIDPDNAEVLDFADSLEAAFELFDTDYEDHDACVIEADLVGEVELRNLTLAARPEGTKS
jgi:hypothetical protein